MPGYLVSRPYRESNVGSNLASLAGAWWLAQRLGRTLVVDWRGLSQLHDPEINYFSEFFETPPQLADVPVLYAPADIGGYDEDGGAAWLSPEEAQQLGRRGAPAPRATIVLQTYHGLDRVHGGSEAERFRLLRSFYALVRPCPAVRTAVDSWARAHLGGAFVVGVNVRTGNGQYFAKGQPYHGRVDIGIFSDRDAFLARLERACRRCAARLPRPLRDDFVVFYATDSAEMAESLARLPNAVTRRRRWPPAGSGDLYAFDEADYDDRNAVVDTLADMFLLARCDALVYNSSMFNQYARVLNGWFSGNHVHIESTYLRHRVRYTLWRARRMIQR